MPKAMRLVSDGAGTPVHTGRAGPGVCVLNPLRRLLPSYRLAPAHGDSEGPSPTITPHCLLIGTYVDGRL